MPKLAHNKAVQLGHFSAMFELCQKNLAQLKHHYKMLVNGDVMCSYKIEVLEEKWPKEKGDAFVAL